MTTRDPKNTSGARSATPPKMTGISRIEFPVRTTKTAILTEHASTTATPRFFHHQIMAPHRRTGPTTFTGTRTA